MYRKNFEKGVAVYENENLTSDSLVAIYEYEVLENGYLIKLNKQDWILQTDDNGIYPIPRVNDDGTWNYEEMAKAIIEDVIYQSENAENQQSQLDRIESNTASLKVEIEQDAIDNFTMELVKNGLL